MYHYQVEICSRLNFDLKRKTKTVFWKGLVQRTVIVSYMQIVDYHFTLLVRLSLLHLKPSTVPRLETIQLCYYVEVPFLPSPHSSNNLSSVYDLLTAKP